MKKTYIKPEIELMEARVEKGFAGSGYVDDNPNVRPGHGWGDTNHEHHHKWS